MALLSAFMRRPSEKQVHALRTLLPTNAEKPAELYPDELERLAVYVYIRLGFRNVKHTGAHSSTDGGVDVWMLSRQGEVVVVQCKQWQTRVGKSELIEFAKVMRRSHAVQGHYWAPNGFSQPAVDYAEQNNIELYSDYRIRKVLEKVIEIDNAIAAQHSAIPVVAKPHKSKWTTAQIAIIFGMVIVACSIILFMFSMVSSTGT